MNHAPGLHAQGPGPFAPAADPAPRDQFFGMVGVPPRVVPLDLPGGEGRVYLRPMSGLAREKLEQGIGDGKSCTVRAQMTVASLCDEAGRFIMTERDIEQVNQAPWTVLDAIYRAALELNGMGPGAVDAAAKN